MSPLLLSFRHAESSNWKQASSLWLMGAEHRLGVGRKRAFPMHKVNEFWGLPLSGCVGFRRPALDIWLVFSGKIARAWSVGECYGCYFDIVTWISQLGLEQAGAICPSTNSSNVSHISARLRVMYWLLCERLIALLLCFGFFCLDSWSQCFILCIFWEIVQSQWNMHMTIKRSPFPFRCITWKILYLAWIILYMKVIFYST